LLQPLSELLATWAAHDLTHLRQISRVMAHCSAPATALRDCSEYLRVHQYVLPEPAESSKVCFLKFRLVRKRGFEPRPDCSD
jgi:hypothetical protein